MENSKQLQTINNTILSNIESGYVNDIKDIQQYYPKHIKDQVENLSDDIKKDIVKSGRRMTSGIKSSIPMVCKGKDCCLKTMCELFKNNIAPLSYQCPYEELMVDKLTSEYYTTLEVDPFNRVERDLIKQMVELIIIDNRTSADLSTEGLYSKQTVGFDKKGNQIENTVESLAYSIKMKTQIRVQKIQNELLATRKIKKQLDTGKRNDPSSQASNLYEKYKDFASKNLVNAEMEIIDATNSKKDEGNSPK